jgi:hypothetical protein
MAQRDERKNSNQNERFSDNNSASTNHKTINHRIDIIREIVGNSNITPLTDFDSKNVTNPNDLLKHNDHDCDLNTNCKDSTCILKKKLVNFKAMINKMGTSLEYIKSGTTGHTFKGEVKLKNGEIVNFAMKIVAYPIKEKYGDLYDIRRPENAELAIIKLLSWFIATKQTPHIVLPVGTFNIDLKKFVDMAKAKIIDNERFDKFLKRFDDGDFYPIASVLVGEWADGGDLLDFLKEHYKKLKLIHWKVLFYQLFSALAIIQEKYPAFRHNDLKANNLLVNLINTDKKGIFKYHLKNQYFIVPNVGFSIKIWDFDFACIPGIADNAKVNAKWTNDINVRPRKNRYYDIHYFFNTLTKKAFFPKIMTSEHVPKEVKEFVRRIVPEKYVSGRYVAEKGRILKDDEYVIPIDILIGDDFFSELRYSEEQMHALKNHLKSNINKQIDSDEELLASTGLTKDDAESPERQLDNYASSDNKRKVNLDKAKYYKKKKNIVDC